MAASSGIYTAMRPYPLKRATLDELNKRTGKYVTITDKEQVHRRKKMSSALHLAHTCPRGAKFVVLLVAPLCLIAPFFRHNSSRFFLTPTIAPASSPRRSEGISSLILKPRRRSGRRENATTLKGHSHTSLASTTEVARRLHDLSEP